MTTEKTSRIPSDESLDREIDRCASVIIQSSNIDDCTKTAVVLDTLMRYRADREARDAREKRRGVPPASPLPAWAKAGQRVNHAGDIGVIIAREDTLARIVVHYPANGRDTSYPADQLGYVVPCGEDGRADAAAMGGDM